MCIRSNELDYQISIASPTTTTTIIAQQPIASVQQFHKAAHIDLTTHHECKYATNVVLLCCFPSFSNIAPRGWCWLRIAHKALWWWSSYRTVCISPAIGRLASQKLSPAARRHCWSQYALVPLFAKPLLRFAVRCNQRHLVDDTMQCR